MQRFPLHGIKHSRSTCILKTAADGVVTRQVMHDDGTRQEKKEGFQKDGVSRIGFFMQNKTLKLIKVRSLFVNLKELVFCVFSVLI